MPSWTSSIQRSVATPEGLAALMHALAHIEFNAINLATDITWRFPGMPEQFYLDWTKVAREEAYHFTLLSERLVELGHAYGDFPAHDARWTMAGKTRHDLLARLALVPRTLEARGLDASPAIRNKLVSVGDKRGAEILDIILRDEIGHVAIGNRWVKWLLHDDQEHLKALADEVENLRQTHDARVATLVKAALGDTGESDGPVQATDDEPTPVNVISLRIAGFSEDEIAELVQKGGGNAALE